MNSEEIVSKRPKVADMPDSSDCNEKSDAAGSSNPQTGVIFKLNNHCLEKIFDYLSLKDLHSLSETCRDMQQHTGDFFQLNYAANQNNCARSGVTTAYHERGRTTKRKTFIKISSFNRFMRNFTCSLIGLHFHYIRWHYTEFESIQHIYIQNSYLNFHKYFNITMGHMLKNVEVVELRDCTIDTNLYDFILIFCKHLKQLHVQESQLGLPKNSIDPPPVHANKLQHATEISMVSYPWLLNTYSTLEHLELMPRYVFEIDELCEFFELNRNVRSFSTSTQCLWANRQKLLGSNLHLDVLEIKFHHNKSHPNLESICSLLKQLYAREFYKKLHFYFHGHKNHTLNVQCQHVFLLDELEKLFIERFHRNYDISHLTNLKELAIVRDFTTADMEYLAKHLQQLERLDLIQNASSEHILPFIRHSVNLTKIRVGSDAGFPLTLRKFSEERTKLINARKVTIYVPDNLYLNLKWNFNYGGTDFDAIKIRRTTSYDWNHRYVF